jgi:hypothetical protein
MGCPTPGTHKPPPPLSDHPCVPVFIGLCAWVRFGRQGGAAAAQVADVQHGQHRRQPYHTGMYRSHYTITLHRTCTRDHTPHNHTTSHRYTPLTHHNTPQDMYTQLHTTSQDMYTRPHTTQSHNITQVHTTTHHMITFHRTWTNHQVHITPHHTSQDMNHPRPRHTNPPPHSHS